MATCLFRHEKTFAADYREAQQQNES